MSANTWSIDHLHSAVTFTVRHMVVSKVHGRFAKWNATLQLDDGDLTRSSVEAHIEAASIDTGVNDRDNHLRSPDFLDAAHFPELTFKSTKIAKVSAESYRIVGDLTIHGVTKEVTLDAEYNGLQKSPWGDERTGFSAHTSINRSDFGLTWNKMLEAGGVLVAERVDIGIEIEAVKQSAASPKAA